jgi:hypothetical protein
VAADGGVATCLGGELVAAQRRRHDRFDQVGREIVGGVDAGLSSERACSEQGRGALVGVGCRGQGAEAGCRLGLRAIAGKMQLRDGCDRLRLAVEGRLVRPRLPAIIGDLRNGLRDFPG